MCRGRFETGTYHCEALPDFSSAGFMKTLCRLLDILEGWEGPAHPGKWAMGGRGPPKGENLSERMLGGRCPGATKTGSKLKRGSQQGLERAYSQPSEGGDAATRNRKNQGG